MRSTTPKKLKSAIKTHYQEKSLSEDQLSHLLSLQDELACKPKAENPVEKSSWVDMFNTWFKRPKTLIPTLALASIMMVVSLMPMPISGPNIIQEIAGHHENPSEISVYTSSIEELEHKLSKLSFKLVVSSKLGSEMWQLLGGSYCSINGELAAQLKIKNLENNQVYTFYQAEFPEGLTLEQSSTENIINSQGTDVTIWQEKGLLLGIAHSPP